MSHILYLKQKGIFYTCSILWLALALHACIGADSRNSIPLPTKVIVILNGLWQSADTLNSTIQSLSTTFVAEGLEVQIHKVIEVQTSERSITDQASYAFSQIQQYYSGPSYEIILIGHSQGGLRGAKILAHHSN